MTRGIIRAAALAICVALSLAPLAAAVRAQEVQELPEEPFARGKALLLRGQFPAALEAFEAVLAGNPDNREALYYRGVARLRLKNIDGATADFRALLEGEAPLALGHAGLAEVAILRKQYPEAQKEIAAAQALDPQNAEAHYQQGMLLGYQKKTPEAIAAFQRALAIDPGHAYAHYNIALAYNQQKRKDMAIQHLDKFLALAPLAPEAPQVRQLLNMLRR